MTSNQPSPISRDEWREHVAAWRASKLTQAEYFRQHELKLNVFRNQINRRQGALAKTLTLVPTKVQIAPAGMEVVLHGPKG